MPNDTSFKVGLVGARGYVGRELLGLIAADRNFELHLATSREHVGRSVGEVFEGADSNIKFTASSPQEVASAGCDVIVLGLPNGLAAPFVSAIEKAAPETLIVDLSADYRHQPGWAFGFSDLWQNEIRGSNRIANPGCYATAGLLALYPIKDLLAGVPSVFGISGYSGAGTTPSPKNDIRRLRGNIIPYGFAGHGHQSEMAETLGQPVRFMPHVAEFFRGLITTISVQVGSGVTERQIAGRYASAYAGNQTVRVIKNPPEIRDVVHTPTTEIGGISIDPTTQLLSVACVHDNLLKGAASQAMANVRLGLGLD